jgi:hypothetical protein
MNAGDASREADTEHGSRGPFLPLLLLTVAFLGWSVIQTTQLTGDRLVLQAASAQQTGPLESAYKIRVAADSLAAKTQALSSQGNANAQSVIAKLKERGITINANATTSAPPY